NVGDQVPISTQSSVSVTDPNAPVVNSIEYRDTGVVLEITPRVNASGLVVLDIIQEVSDVIPTDTSEIDSPTIQQRRIETTVAVQSGETVALGGLIRDNRSDGVSGVPVLSEIPILGNLFKTNIETSLRTELLVLITPRVITNVEEATAAMKELRARMTGLAPLERRVKRFVGEPAAQ
ncbi:MAG: type II secretion system protein GspD, partial [Methyloligellaceae bacterium]